MIFELRKNQEQLLQSRKMAAVGRGRVGFEPDRGRVHVGHGGPCERGHGRFQDGRFDAHRRYRGRHHRRPFRPVMVYLLRMPMHVVVGTSLFQILFTCTNVTIMQAWMNHTVDFILALLLVGSVVGAQIGARINRRLKADQLKVLMSVIVMIVMVKMLLGLLIAPEIMVSYVGGH